MRHPSVTLHILVNELCFLFSFRWSLVAVIHFHNDFIVMNYFFYSPCISFKLLHCRIEISFYILKFVCLYMYVFIFGKGFCVPWHMGGHQRTTRRNLFSPSTMWVLSPEAWAHLIWLDDQHLYFLRHLPGMKIEICFSSSIKFPALWSRTLLPSRWFPFNPVRWMKCLKALYYASWHVLLENSLISVQFLNCPLDNYWAMPNWLFHIVGI